MLQFLIGGRFDGIAEIAPQKRDDQPVKIFRARADDNLIGRDLNAAVSGKIAAESRRATQSIPSRASVQNGASRRSDSTRRIVRLKTAAEKPGAAATVTGYGNLFGSGSGEPVVRTKTDEITASLLCGGVAFLA